MNARGKQSKKNQKTGGTTDVSDVCSPQRQRQQLSPQSAGDAASSASATRSAGGRAPASSGSPSPQKRPSYNAAMLAGEMSGLAAITSDGLWEWHTGEEEAEEVKNPLGGREKSTKGSGKLSQSTPGKVNMPQHIGSPPLVAAPVNTRSRAGSHPVPLPPPSPSSTVVAAPDRIQLGFQPPVMTTMEVDQQQHHHQPSSVVETTRSSDLPGSVITTPPHALSAAPLKGNERSAPLLSPTPAGTGRLVPTSMGGSARTVQSIEEASRVRENYAPPLPLALTRASGDEHLDFSGTIVMEEAAGGNTFCLDLTSFIRGPQQLQHQQQHQAATAAAKKGGGAHAHEERRGSSSSQFSTISVSFVLFCFVYACTHFIYQCLFFTPNPVRMYIRTYPPPYHISGHDNSLSLNSNQQALDQSPQEGSKQSVKAIGRCIRGEKRDLCFVCFVFVCLFL